MRRLRRTVLTQTGDTIVEVLVAISIVSMVLGGAYATTNHSLQASRSGQEQGVAIKLIEGQLEQLKALADTTGGLSGAPASFCVVNSGGRETAVSTTTPGAPCSLDSRGLTATVGEQPVYQIAITEPSPDNFQIVNRWFDVNGTGNDSITMNYRVYPQ